MKIVVNGNIIDTENIYSISSTILDGYNDETYKPEYYFEIESFNKKYIRVSIGKHSDLDDVKSQSLTTEERIEYLKSIFELNLSKIEKMRQDIVNIWSENQTKIPNFDIKKY